MICPKCGEKNKEGASFCSKCGEKLAGKSSEKTAKKSKISADDVKDAAAQVTKEMTNEASNIIRDMVAKPVDTLKKYGDEKRFNLALALIGVMSLLAGLFSIALIKNLYSAIMDFVQSMYGGLLGMASSYGQQAEIPYFKVFFITLIATFVLSFVFVGILYFVSNVLFKGKESFKKMYVVYGIVSIVVSATLLVSLVLSFIGVKIAAVVLSLGFGLSSFYVFHMIRLVGPSDENKHGYIYVISTALFYLATYIILQLFM